MRGLPGDLESGENPIMPTTHSSRRGLIQALRISSQKRRSVFFLLGLDYLAPKGWTEEQIANLVYVGITRARYRLIIPYVNQAPLIDTLQIAS